MKFRGGIFYWAYGSNLNVYSMKSRCPTAVKVKPLALEAGALVFRGVADVVSRENSTVQGGLWYVKWSDVEALDRYEGVAGGLYDKKYLTLGIKGERHKCLYYQMGKNHRGVMPPSEWYLEIIMEGYHDFGLPLEPLEVALQEAWNNKKVTPELRKRHIRRGGELARLP